MDSEEAKWKITEAVGGKRVTTYKLRDWVFSRQHYWGEPIPMVYCDSCAKVKQKILVIHGFEGSPDTSWHSWIKNELEKAGFEVRVPKMSTADHPVLATWLKELLPLVKDFGPNDVVIGHSLGSKAALHLLLKAKKKIGNLLLIGSAIGELSERDWEKMRKEWQGSDIDSLKKFWLVPIDFDNVSRYAENIKLIVSKDDPDIPLHTHKDIPKSWHFEVWDGFGHFTAEKMPELRDWILNVKNDGWIPVPEKDLPVELPKVEKYQPTDTGESPLSAIKSFVNTKCPRCGGVARRETDTMPNWAGSSWYYLAYIAKRDSRFKIQDSRAKQSFARWLPVDWYNGGMEHTTLHLLYSRFWHKFLFDIGVVPTFEPYQKRTSHGMILAEGGVKMSKSKGNVINPDDLVRRFGADSLRVYEMFMGPFDQTIAWNTDGLVGTSRFLEKVWRIGQKHDTNKRMWTNDTNKNSKLANLVHKTVKKVGEDIEAMRFNTAISALMICANEMDNAESVPKDLFEMYLKILSPFAPHIAEELWNKIGHKNLIATEIWPVYDPAKIVDDEVTIVVQINGKVRAQFSVSSDITEQDAIEKAKALPEIKKWLEGKPIKKEIFVKGRLVNLVI
jgi:leucyl-tRNA synthetase/predicted alpha/beta hydrolase family esterase